MLEATSTPDNSRYHEGGEAPGRGATAFLLPSPVNVPQSILQNRILIFTEFYGINSANSLIFMEFIP